MHAGGCRTEDPDQADFFFVPVYAACVMTQERLLARDMESFYTDLLKSQLSHFARREGRDHIFLWSSASYDFPSWAEYIRGSVFLTVEANPVTCTDFDFFAKESAQNFSASCWHCPSCYQPSKDIVIPGVIGKWAVDRLVKSDRNLDQRSLLACYHGADSQVTQIYKFANATVRNRLQDLDQYPGTSIGSRFSIIMHYFDRIGQCIFCFVPKGLGYWSNRLYEVMFAGCIPVILSDSIGLPFTELTDWTSFSVKWPMAEVGEPLLDHLRWLLDHRPITVQQLHANVRRNRCWFNWHLLGNRECSPYKGIMRSLQRKLYTFPHWPGKQWRPGISKRT
eukprot:gnl/TRDRNA2_/TRDRNA2_29031_c0_seq1.p1 gnl/TRDRNA2_/TRDRNA2_29031_c0~~gnl/TRDRNA2_/TRDRNA2_29031_c0_seq1.p1  ORF type:complete len:386 (+),score=20.23 gnl/TRDRNA2_/TRDRNA2_29031_c0_seq1:153-1160(+)